MSTTSFTNFGFIWKTLLKLVAMVTIFFSCLQYALTSKLFLCVFFSFYVLGGGHLAGAIGLEQLSTYHFETRTWSSVKTVADPKHGIPKSRSSFGCIQRGSWVVILGGRHYSVNVLDVLNVGLDDVWLLDLSSLQWSKMDIILPKPMYFHTVSLTPSGMLYIYGGIVEHEKRSSDIYRLQLFMPSLAELAWQKLIEETDSFNNINREDLINIGLPLSYIDRLPP